MEIISAGKMYMAFNMRRVMLILLTVLGETCLSEAYGPPKYTWPLYRGNILLETQRQVNGETSGCSVSGGLTHAVLGYESAHMTGGSNSYIDVTIESTDELEFDDYAFSVFARSSTTGGTLFHYKQDDAAVDTHVEKVRELILWYNQTHIAVEMYGPNGETYGSITVQYVSVVDTWVGYAVSYDREPHSKLKLVTDTDVDSEVITQKVLIGQPGILRIGGTFGGVYEGFNGDMICANMYGSKMNHNDLPESLVECEYKEEWDDGAESSSEQCDAQKGYFKLKQKDSAIDVSVATLDNMATMSCVQCADLCLKTALCVSFTLDKTVGACKLFGDDYSSRIMSSTGTNYYMRLDVCC